MAKKPATKKEREHMAKVAALGCLVCSECLGIEGTPAELHHPIGWAGLGKRASHYEVISLCPTHHRNGGYGVAIHAGKKKWEENFKTQEEFLEIVKQKLSLDY